MPYGLTPSVEIETCFSNGESIPWEQYLDNLQDRHLWQKMNAKDLETCDIDKLVCDFLDECIQTCVTPIREITPEQKDAFIRETIRQIKEISEKIESKIIDKEQKRTAFEALYESIQYVIERLSNTFRSMTMICIQEQT